MVGKWVRQVASRFDRLVTPTMIVTTVVSILLYVAIIIATLSGVGVGERSSWIAEVLAVAGVSVLSVTSGIKTGSLGGILATRKARGVWPWHDKGELHEWSLRTARQQVWSVGAVFLSVQGALMVANWYHERYPEADAVFYTLAFVAGQSIFSTIRTVTAAWLQTPAVKSITQQTRALTKQLDDVVLSDLSDEDIQDLQALVEKARSKLEDQ